jgi:hypothetical protein
MALLDRFARKPQETAAIETVGTDAGDAVEAIALPVPGVPKVVQGTFRKAEIVLPEEAQLCSGIVIYGRLIKTLAFSTDLYIIRNCNADAVLAVAPFTNQPIITKSLVQAAERPVITGAQVGVDLDLRRDDGHRASRIPEKICRRSGRSPLRNVVVATRGCAAQEPPRSTRYSSPKKTSEYSRCGCATKPG